MAQKIKIKIPSLPRFGKEELSCRCRNTNDDGAQPIETTYYSSKIRLPDICFQCGSTSGAALADLTNMVDKFAQVRPSCVHCQAQGLKPSTRAPVLTNSSAKKKK